MKRSKRLLVLVSVLTVICVATFVLMQYEEKQEEIQNSDAIILEIPTDTVKSLSWTISDEGLAFSKDSQWLYDEDTNFPVSETKINSILSHFEALGASFIIENVENYAQYGLDAPEAVIYLSTNEKSYEIKLGAFSKMDEQRYIDIGDGNVYLVSDDPMEYLETDLSDMILHDNTPSLDNVNSIKFSGLENYTILKIEDSTYSYQPADIYFTESGGQNLPLDTSIVTDYLDSVSNLNLQNYVTYYATAEELEAFGLDSPELSVTIEYTYTQYEDENDKEGVEITDTCTLHISRNPEELKAYEEAVAAAENGESDDDLPEVTKYVRVGESQIVYQLSDASYNTLSEVAYDDLRHKEVIWADFDSITQIDVLLEGESHSLTSAVDEDDDEADRIWSYDGEEISISSLRSALEDLTASEFTNQSPTGVEEISLTVYLDDANFPQVKIQLYRYDGSSCLAVVDGSPVSFVSRTSVMDLVEAVQSIVLN